MVTHSLQEIDQAQDKCTKQGLFDFVIDFDAADDLKKCKQLQSNPGFQICLEFEDLCNLVEIVKQQKNHRR